MSYLIMRSARPSRKRRPQLEKLRAKIGAIEPGALTWNTGQKGRLVASGQRPDPVSPDLASPDVPSKTWSGSRLKSGPETGPETDPRTGPKTLPDILPGLHEVCPGDYLDTPAALTFQTGLLSARLAAAERPPLLVWVRQAENRGGNRAHDFGRPCPLALKARGLRPDHILLVETRDMKDALWAMEEALSAGAWLIGEAGQTHHYDLTASKRLHLAARARNALALILRGHGPASPSAALTRWRISARPSPAMAWRGATGLPGLGFPRFRAQLERVRGGPPQDFEIEWKNATLHVLEPAPVANPTPQTGPHTRLRRAI